MNTRMVGWTIALGALAAFGSGCIITGGGTTCGNAGQICCGGNACNGGLACDTSGTCVTVTTGLPAPYTACTPAGGACQGATVCTQSNLMSQGMNAGNHCTAGCAAGAQCPAGGACVVVGGVGQCYAQCPTGQAQCGLGSTCARIGAFDGNVCIPDGGFMTPFPAPYTPCMPLGGVCDAGTFCQRSNLMSIGMNAGNHCSSGCTAGTQCPAGGACVIANNVGQCYAQCPGGQSQCATGATCGAVPGFTGNVCIPNGGTVMGPTFYEGCAPVPSACADGSVCSQARVDPPGTTGFCSRACTASASECPQVRGRIVDCYRIRNATQGVCMIACADGRECPTGTQCRETCTETFCGVRVCMQPGG
jgi:hypothetical protein